MFLKIFAVFGKKSIFNACLLAEEYTVRRTFVKAIFLFHKFCQQLFQIFPLTTIAHNTVIFETLGLLANFQKKQNCFRRIVLLLNVVQVKFCANSEKSYLQTHTCRLFQRETTAKATADLCPTCKNFLRLRNKMLLLLQRREGRHCLPNAPPRLHRCLFTAKSSADGKQICVCFDDYSSLFALIFSSDSSKYLS